MNSLLVISFLNELEQIYLHTSIAIVFTQFNGFNYSNQTLIILFNINHLFAYKYCDLTVIILLNTIHSFAQSQMVPSIAMLNQ